MSDDNLTAIAYLRGELDSEAFIQKALAEKLSLEVTSIRQEGVCHPAQWTCGTTDCVEIYVRYRDGVLTVERTVIDDEKGATLLLIYGVRGWTVEPDMSTCCMLSLTGLRPTNDCEWDVQNL